MDTTKKVVTIHLIGAIVSAALSTVFTLGWIGFKNDVLAFVVGIIILYFLGQFCQKTFGEDISGFKDWLWDGIVPFLLSWFIAWTIMYNYLGMPLIH